MSNIIQGQVYFKQAKGNGLNLIYKNQALTKTDGRIRMLKKSSGKIRLLKKLDGNNGLLKKSDGRIRMLKKSNGRIRLLKKYHDLTVLPIPFKYIWYIS